MSTPQSDSCNHVFRYMSDKSMIRKSDGQKVYVIVFYCEKCRKIQVDGYTTRELEKQESEVIERLGAYS